MSILLVEDNPAHAELVIRSFEAHRIASKIHHVSDGEAALDFLFQRNEYAGLEESIRPNLVLLDLRLPKVDGLEVLTAIKDADHELKNIPVVILTTSETERDVAQAYEHHANSYLVKPVNFAKFTELMKELGFYWLGWNRSPW